MILEIDDDSGFIGIVNHDKYEAFIAPDWDFAQMKERIISQINAGHLLFWATGSENTWSVLIGDQVSARNAFREAKGFIEVTNGSLYLTNYESLTMGAQFEEVQLPEPHHAELNIPLENGKYQIRFRQMFDPDEDELDPEMIGFELIVSRVENFPELYCNKVSEIYWSVY